MYLTRAKTTLVQAGESTYTDNYPNYPDLGFGLEYPADAAEYPKIWVDFEPETLKKQGIDPIYYTPIVGGLTYPYLGWKYTGTATFTIVALSSRERDGIFDDFCSVLAFSSVDPVRAPFRALIDSNPYVAMMFDWDQILTSGKNESSGTPWGTNEVVYEITISMVSWGEYFSAPAPESFAILRDVKITPTVEAP